MSVKQLVSKKDWIAYYKEYLLEKGALPKDLNELIQFKDLPYASFREQFESLRELEVALVLWYFKASSNTLTADEQFESFSSKEKHLAFLYTLVEQLAADGIFAADMLHHKQKDKSFIAEVLMGLNKQDLGWSYKESWKEETLKNIGINPKKSVLLNHALSVIVFWSKDKSENKQDTDAYIEKTTDLLFKLTDTSTLSSILDVGKFMFSRRNNVFTWDD